MSDSPPRIKSFGISFGAGGAARSEVPNRSGVLKIVVISALDAGADYTTRAAPPSAPIAIDKASFERVMQQLAPAFAIEVADPFASDGRALRIDLKWPELKSMRPDGIVDQVHALRGLVEARAIVTSVRDRKTSVEDARARLARTLPSRAWADALLGEVTQSPAPLPTTMDLKPAAKPPATPPAKTSKGDVLDALFEKVDVAVEPEKPARAAEEAPAVASGGLSAIVAMVAHGGRPRSAPPTAAVGTALETLDRAFGKILSQILRHPEVRRLERAWRGLRLLVDGSDARSGVEIDVVVAQKDGVEDALRGLGESSIDLLVIDHEITASERDAHLLSAWARIASELHAPIVVNGDASLLGLASLEQLPKASRLLADSEDARAPKTRAFGADEACRWVTVAMNGPLVRAAYTPSTSRVREVPFAEAADDRQNHVFAGPALPIAILCAKSYARSGWPCAILGPRDGVLENLPVHETRDAGPPFAIPLEILCSDDVVKKAARAGIALFTCAPNRDAAVLTRAPVFHKKGDLPSSTLVDQLFVGRFARAVQQVAAAIPANVPTKAGAEAAEIALAELFAGAGHAGPEVQARIEGERLAVTVRPRHYGGVSLEELTLTAALGY